MAMGHVDCGAVDILLCSNVIDSADMSAPTQKFFERGNLLVHGLAAHGAHALILDFMFARFFDVHEQCAVLTRQCGGSLNKKNTYPAFSITSPALILHASSLPSVSD